MNLTNTPGHIRPVVRHYSVALIPVTLMADGTEVDELELDEGSVTLSYSLARAEQLDRNSEEAYNEAFARAVKVERKAFQVADNRTFRRGTTRFIRERMSTNAAVALAGASVMAPSAA